jgi:hypothetical protein
MMAKGAGTPEKPAFPGKRFQAKWEPVRVKKTRQIKNLEPRFDAIETEKGSSKKAQNLDA